MDSIFESIRESNPKLTIDELELDCDPNEGEEDEDVLSDGLRAAVIIESSKSKDTWEVTSDREKILEANNPIFVKSMDELLNRLEKLYPGRVGRDRPHRGTVDVWKHEIINIKCGHAIRVSSGLYNSFNGEELDSANSLQVLQLVMEIKEKAIDNGSVIVSRSILSDLASGGHLRALSGFDHDDSIGLVAGGFVVDWDSDETVFSYDEKRFNKIFVIREKSAKKKKKKEAENRKKGIREIDTKQRTFITGFRSWLLFCLQREVPVFSRFKYLGEKGRGTLKASQDIKDLLKICKTMKVDFRIDYTRPKSRRQRTKEGDYSQVNYLEFIKNMNPYTKGLRLLRHKKEVNKDAIAAIHWLSRWIEREHKNLKWEEVI